MRFKNKWSEEVDTINKAIHQFEIMLEGQDTNEIDILELKEATVSLYAKLSEFDDLIGGWNSSNCTIGYGLYDNK